MFDEGGHIRPAEIGGPSTLPGPIKGCGYQLNGTAPTWMILQGPMFGWHWAVRVGYLSSADTTATLRLGDGSHDFAVARGLHQIFFYVDGGGSGVEMRLHDATTTVCVDAVTVGTAKPHLPA